MENKMPIPSSLQVGGQNLKVNIVDRIDNDKLGECCVAEARIDIAKNFGTRIQAETIQLNTFFHELTHCILDTMGESELSGNEKFVSTFSSFLCEAINSFSFDEKENGREI